MRTLRFPILAILLIAAALARAETAAEFEALGIAALKRAQEAPDEIIDAALFLGQAALAYEKEQNEEKVQDVNGCLFWCKKKMSLQQMETFLKEKDPAAQAAAKRLAEIEKPATPADAQKYFDRAEAFAKANPDEQLLIAIRFFEVAGRFKGTDVSLTAQDRSLQAMTQAQKRPANAPPPVAPAPEPGKKTPVPPPEKLAEVEKMLRELFAADFKKTAPADKAALAKKLVDVANGSRDVVEKYGTLLQAATLAAQGGDLATFLDLHAQLDDAYDADPSNPKKAGLTALLAATRDPAITKAATALKTLADKPDDPLANRNAGKYLVFVRGDWARGMAFLAKGNSPELKRAAELDAAMPTESAAQSAAGDAWWEISEKTADKEEKSAYRDRAGYWYLKALPGMTGLVKVRTEKRLASAEPAGRSAPRAGATANAPASSNPPQMVGFFDIIEEDGTPTGSAFELKADGFLTNSMKNISEKSRWSMVSVSRIKFDYGTSTIMYEYRNDGTWRSMNPKYTKYLKKRQ